MDPTTREIDSIAPFSGKFGRLNRGTLGMKPSRVEDPKYEFQAPKYHDFLDNSEDSQLDQWFDNKDASPLSSHNASQNFPLLNPTEENEDLAAERALEEALSELNRVRFRETSLPSSLDHTNDTMERPEDTLNLFYENYAEEKLPEKTPTARLIAAAARTRLASPSRVVQEEIPSTPEKPSSQSGSTKSSPVPNVDFVPIRSQRPLTVPKEFNLSSPKLKPQPQEIPTRPREVIRARPEIKSRPEPIRKPDSRPRPLTVPKPFVFHTTHRTRNLEPPPEKSPFVPLALKVKQFQTKTPDRFKVPPPQDKYQPRITRPKSPNFSTSSRSAPEPKEPMERPTVAAKISMSTLQRLSLPKRQVEVPPPLPVTRHRSVYVKSPQTKEVVKPTAKLQAWEAAPFVPRKSMKPLTVVEDVSLATSSRIRRPYEPKPIENISKPKVGGPIQIKPSSRPLTNPKSPKIGNKRQVVKIPEVEPEPIQEQELEEEIEEVDLNPTINAFRNIKLRPIRPLME